MRTLNAPWRRVLIGSWVMIAVLSVTTLILYTDNKRTRGCISTYMTRDAASTETRIELAESERTKFKVTLRSLLSEPDRAKRLASIEEYIALLDKNDVIRKENPPLPVPTSCSSE